MLAAERRQLAIVKVLLEAGADINARSNVIISFAQTIYDGIGMPSSIDEIHNPTSVVAVSVCSRAICF